MRAFLQSLDEKIQQVVETSWTKPKETPTDWDDAKIKAVNFNSRVLNAIFSAVMNEEFKKISSTETTKEAWTIQTKLKEAPVDWDDAKIKVANFNSRVLNAVFSAITNEDFKKISSTETAKEAWTILQTTYEGTKVVKDSKLQRLTTSFEEIKMEEDESFDEFYVKLKDMVNSAFNLGETISEPKVVRKVLKSLLERFHAKIIAIEESKDIDSIPLIELVGNLQIYELGLTRIRKGSKSKSMALKVKSNETDESSDDEDSKMKSYITRQFKKFMKNANVKGFDKDHKQSSSSHFKSQDRGKKDAKDSSQYIVPSRPKCFGC